MNEALADEFGRLIDSLDNLAHALTMPIPAHIHMDAMKSSLPEKVAAFKAIYVKATGENPWA